MLSPYLSGGIAFLACAASLPAVNMLAKSLGLYDLPGPLKIHRTPISRLGGISMMAGLLAAGAATWFADLASLVLPCVAIAAVWAVGLADDLKSLPSYLRFIVHILAGAGFWLGGWRLHWSGTAIVDLAATCLFTAFIVNAMNLLDGMDGLAAGTGAMAALGLVAISASQGGALHAISWSLLGICAGMLVLNFPPARMFMGDSGSTLIGVLLAFLALEWVRSAPSGSSVAVPLLFIGLPLADALFAIVRRARNSAALFSGDRSHFYDILLRHGWSVRGTLGASLGITAVLVFTGWLCRNSPAAEVIAAAIAIGLAAAGYAIGSFRNDFDAQSGSPKQQPLQSFLE